MKVLLVLGNILIIPYFFLLSVISFGDSLDNEKWIMEEWISKKFHGEI